MDDNDASSPKMYSTSNNFYLSSGNGGIDEKIEDFFVVDFHVGYGHAERRLDAGVNFLEYMRQRPRGNTAVLQ